LNTIFQDVGIGKMNPPLIQITM